MTQEQVQQIKNNPNYQRLVSSRSKFAWTLSVIMMVVYYAFIMLIAFSPETLGAKTGDGMTTVGIHVGIGWGIIVPHHLLVSGRRYACIRVARTTPKFDIRI